MVILSFQADDELVRDIDGAATCAEATRSEWIRSAVREGLLASRDERSRPPREVMCVAVSVGSIPVPPGFEDIG